MSWKDCWSFEDYIMHLINTKQTESSEFQTMLRIMGREKLEAIYKKNRSKRTETARDSSDSHFERDMYEWKQEMLELTS